MGVSKTTVHCWTVALTLHVHSNSLKPILTEENRLARFEMAMDSMDLDDLTNIKTCVTKFMWMRSVFFSPRRRKGTFSISTKKTKHCVKHKSHITKVMFLGAVVRPCFNPCSNSWWDGKNRSQTTGLREHWCGKTRLLLRKLIRIYLFPSSFHPSWRNGLEGTCCQGKFSFNKMGQETTLVGMTSYSMMHW